MSDDRYRAWRAQLDRRMGEPQPSPSPAHPSEDPLASQVLRVVDEARRVVEGIDAVANGVSVADKTKYDFVLGMLDKLLTFDEFVLAEYTYRLPAGERPGIRLLLERAGGHRHISVVLFEDTQIWRVDWEGQRVSYQLLRLELGAQAPRARIADESQEYFDPAWSWPEYLREALCLPVQLMRSN